jgi:acyl-coenzyme A thioesterase PaaI-like protein
VSASLGAATQVQRDRPGRYTVDVDPAWSIGGMPHGGYLMVLAMHAALDASPHPDPLALSTHFLRPPAFGHAIAEVDELRTGRTVATHRIRLVENDKPVLEMTLTSGHLPDDVPVWTDPAPVLPDQSDCVPAKPMTPTGVPVRIVEQCDMRLDPSALVLPRTGDAPAEPRVRAWLRMNSGEPDVDTVVFAADALPPTVFALGLLGWAPTVEMTTLVRAKPAPGWLRVAVTTRLVRGRWFDEEVTVWDSTDALVGQGRQLALVGQSS